MVVPVSDEDVAIRGNNDVRGTPEQVFPLAGGARHTQAHEQVPLRAELQDLVALSSLIAGLAVSMDSVGDQDVAFVVDVNPMRPDEESRPETANQTPFSVEQ